MGIISLRSLVVGKSYMCRNLETVVITGSYMSGSVEVFYDQHGRSYYCDGVPTSAGVSDGFRIVGEL